MYSQLLNILTSRLSEIYEILESDYFYDESDGVIKDFLGTTSLKLKHNDSGLESSIYFSAQSISGQISIYLKQSDQSYFFNFDGSYAKYHGLNIQQEFTEWVNGMIY